MSGVFLRGLWGDQRIDRRRRTLDEVKAAGARDLRPGPMVVGTFGVENDKFCRDLGYITHMMSEEPVVDWLRKKDRCPDLRGNINFGTILWMHKIALLRWAVYEYGEVCWLDWDTQLVQPLPADFWETLKGRAAIQGTLVEYRRIQCWWRKTDKRKLIEGAIIYCRDREVIDRVWAKYLENPTLCDQQIVSMVMDDMDGEWTTAEDWRERYQFERHHLAGVHNVWYANDPLFVTGRSRMSNIKTSVEKRLDRGEITMEQARELYRDLFPHVFG